MSLYYKSKASIAVTHLPTGISEHADGYRSQHANRDACLVRIKSKLALSATHPLPMRASYELPSNEQCPDDLTQHRRYAK
ncbi:hypothetical protein D8I35_05560 [Corticibacter populi]|uniref:Uncharacterized protein n=1 Tax=Corticibacter populi TaxID=1550736 RepID=A0A3M6R056_9BURK|nr:hypothetical protein D8I35_05560 [Corticibacter populi]